MKLSTELTPEHQAIVTVEVDEEQMQRALQRAAQHVSRIRPVPGFRPGKAPYNMVERAVGKDILVEEAIEDLSRSLYRDVLKESNIEPAGQGQLEVVQKEPPILKYTIPLRAEVKLGDYKSIRLTPNEAQVTDEEVTQVLDRFRFNQATTVPVTRGVQKGDTVTLDIQGRVEGREPMDEKNLRVVVGDPKQPSLPFDEQLLGMMPGETKEITYTYPEDYEDESYRGKTAHYTATIQDIKETQLPELNDEFAKAISQFQTLDQFKGNLRGILRRQKEQEAESEFADRVIDEVVARSEIAFPTVMLEHEVDHVLEHTQDDVKRLGLTWVKYLELAGKTAEQFREETRPRAEKQLKRQLALVELMNAENPAVSRDEVNGEIERLIQETERAGGNVNTARKSYTTREGRRNIEFNLQLAKTIARLVAMAKGELTGGRILTPGMVREGEPRPIPTGLITNPNEVPDAEWPRGLERKP